MNTSLEFTYPPYYYKDSKAYLGWLSSKPLETSDELDYNLKKLLGKDYPFNYDIHFYYNTTYPNRQSLYWKPLYESIDEIYANKTHLKKGTIVYQGNMNKSAEVFKLSDNKFGNQIVYLGLDAIISIWYTLELFEIKVRDNELTDLENFYLHTYELIEDIPYTYINTELEEYKEVGTLKEVPESSSSPLVMAQHILHGITIPTYNELGTELTLPASNVKKYLRPIKTYRIDIIKLELLKYMGLHLVDPTNRVIKSL